MREFRGLDRAIILLVVFGGFFLYGWISTWSIFQEKTISSYEPFEFKGEIIVQYQVSGTESLGSYTAPVYKERFTHKTWYNKFLYEQCVIRVGDQTVPGDINHITNVADSVLAANGLPLGYEMVDFRRYDGDGIDCGETSQKEDVYIRLSGYFQRDGNFIVLSKNSNRDYEMAWVKLPAEVFDQVLISSVHNTSFSLDNYHTEIIPSQLGGYQVKVGDPNGLGGWVTSQTAILGRIYDIPVNHVFTNSVAEEKSTKTVVTGGHRECVTWYKGNCRNSEWIVETSKRTVENPVDVIVGFLEPIFP